MHPLLFFILNTITSFFELLKSFIWRDNFFRSKIYYEKGKENKNLTMQFFKISKDEDCFFLKLSDGTIFDFNEISYFYDKESKTFAFVQLAELVNS